MVRHSTRHTHGIRARCHERLALLSFMGRVRLSNEAQAWVAQKSSHKGSALLVLYIIANHAHADGTGSYPSQSTIARESRMSVRGVQYIIDRLESSQELIVETTTEHTEDRFRGRCTYSLPGVRRDGFYVQRPLIEEDSTDANFARARHTQDTCRTDEGRAHIEVRTNLTGTKLEKQNPEFQAYQERQKLEASRLAEKQSRKGKKATFQRPSNSSPKVVNYESTADRRAREASEQIARLAPSIQIHRRRRIN